MDGSWCSSTFVTFDDSRAVPAYDRVFEPATEQNRRHKNASAKILLMASKWSCEQESNICWYFLIASMYCFRWWGPMPYPKHRKMYRRTWWQMQQAWIFCWRCKCCSIGTLNMLDSMDNSYATTYLPMISCVSFLHESSLLAHLTPS